MVDSEFFLVDAISIEIFLFKVLIMGKKYLLRTIFETPKKSIIYILNGKKKQFGDIHANNIIKKHKSYKKYKI